MYVGKIPEIAHLTKPEQEDILEKARYEAFVNLGLSGRAALYMMGCLLLGFAIATLPLFFVDFPGIAWLLFFVSGMLLANLTYQKLYHSLLIRGLKNIQAEPQLT